MTLPTETWLVAAGAFLGAAAALVTAWAAWGRHRRETQNDSAGRYQALIDTLSARVETLEGRVKTLEDKAEERKATISRQGEYIVVLRQHIIEGKPPPPPPPPDPDDTI